VRCCQVQLSSVASWLGVLGRPVCSALLPGAAQLGRVLARRARPTCLQCAAARCSSARSRPGSASSADLSAVRAERLSLVCEHPPAAAL